METEHHLRGRFEWKLFIGTVRLSSVGVPVYVMCVKTGWWGFPVSGHESTRPCRNPCYDTEDFKRDKICLLRYVSRRWNSLPRRGKEPRKSSGLNDEFWRCCVMIVWN